MVIDDFQLKSYFLNVKYQEYFYFYCVYIYYINIRDIYDEKIYLNKFEIFLNRNKIVIFSDIILF